MPNGTVCEFSSGEKGRPGDDVLLVPIIIKPKPPLEFLSHVDSVSGNALSELVKLGAIRDEAGSLAHTTRGGQYARVLAVSLGEAEKFDAQKVRTAAACAMRWLMAEKIGRATLWIDGLITTAVDEPAANFALGMVLGGFKFLEHKTKETDGPAKLSVRVNSGVPGQVQRVMPGIKERVTLGEAVNYSRALSHEPANIINPRSLAAEAKKLAKQTGMKCTLLEREQLKRKGMNGLLSVGDGAEYPPCLIRLDYRAAPRSRAVTALVGKAVTFDTGGYSIKPASGMESMKFDKCGGMTVLGVMKAASDLKLKCNLVGIIAAAENAISEKAYRPADIIKMMSGKTVEIISTDAEGRMILADALWYAQQEIKPTAMIDLATLTGGIGVALGRAAAGIMSNNDELAGELGEAGRRTHERLWRLPLWDDYRELIRGVDTDLRNSSNSRDAHAIVGGMFLKEFVKDDVPWAHLDIAAVSTQENGGPAAGKGATGFGVRLLIDYLQHRTA